MITAADLEKKLAHGDLDPVQLREFANITADLSQFGLVDWCIRGFPSTDGVCAKFHVTPDQLAELMKKIADLKDPRIGGDIFPLGIILPEKFEVRLQLGTRRSGWTGIGSTAF